MDASEEEDGNPMTLKSIEGLIKKHGQYRTPELNDVLYLHYQGFTNIANLEAYTGVKALWLNNNAISKIEGLNTLENLKCLYLANNIIEDIEGLDALENLDTLSLSYNYVHTVQGLSKLKHLTSLELDHNKLHDPDDLNGVLEAPSIQILNISHNEIEDERFLEVLSGLKDLRVLRNEGNPVTRTMKNYRRRIILTFPELRFLDDAPVTEEDRRLAIAWGKGGHDAEKAERELIKAEKDEKHMKHMKEFREMQRKAIIEAGQSLADHPDLLSDDEEKAVTTQEEEEKPDDDSIFFVTEGADVPDPEGKQHPSEETDVD